MSDSSSHYGLLLRHGYRLPAYTAPAIEHFQAAVTPLSETLGSFLRTAADVPPPAINRQGATEWDTETYAIYNVPESDGPGLRVAFERHSLSSTAVFIFKGPIDDPFILGRIGESVARKVVEAIYPGEPHEVPPMTAADDKSLDNRPVLRVRYGLTLGEDVGLPIAIEVARPFLDRLAPPPSVSRETLQQLSFSARGVLCTVPSKMAPLSSLVRGDVVQLPGASLSAIGLRARGREGFQDLCAGEMGKEGRKRSIKLTNFAAHETGDMPGKDTAAAL